MKHGKLLAFGISLLVGVSLLTGCSSAGTNASSSNKKVTVTAWAWDPAYNIPALKEAKAVYEKEHPNVNINIVTMDEASLRQKLQTNLASGSKQGLPDVVLIENQFSQSYLKSYPNAFVPLQNDIKFDQFATGLTSVSEGNNIYGVPFGSATACVFYRTDYFEQAGITASQLNNITWDQFIKLGQEVKAKTGHSVMTVDPSDYAGLMKVMLQSADTYYFDKNGNLNIQNNSVMKDVFEQYQRLMNSGIVTKVSGWANFVAAFNSGQVAAVPAAAWLVPSITQQKDQSGKWGIATIPRLDISGSVNAAEDGGSAFYVLSSSSVKSQAVDFLAKTFAGSTQFYDNLLNNEGINSMWKPAFSLASYNKANAFFGGQKIFADFSTWSTKENMKNVNLGEYTAEVDTVLNPTFQNYLDGKTTLSNALSTIQSQVQQQIKTN